jgi:hypothetical protein
MRKPLSKRGGVGLRLVGVVMAEYPFFRFFTNDWLSHTRCLGAEARGVLIDVVCLAASCERRGFLHTGDRAWTPSDIAKRLTGDPAVNQRALAEILAEGVLSQVDGCYCYAPMVEDAKYTATKADAGAKGGKAKHAASKGLANGKQTSSNDLADTVANGWPQKSEVRSQNAEVRLQNAESETKTNTTPLPPQGGLLPGMVEPEPRKRKPTHKPEVPITLRKDDVTQAFMDFWEVYPRKEKKMLAWQTWDRDGLESIGPKIVESVLRYREADAWTRDGGQYIPHPTTFLNQRMYLDTPKKPDRPAH